MKRPGAILGWGRRRSGADDAAIEWLVRRDAGLSPSEQAALAQWLAAAPENAAALARAAAALRRLQRPREIGRSEEALRRLDAFQCVRQRRSRRWRTATWTGVAIAAIVALAGPSFLRVSDADELTPAPRVAVRPDRRVLADGSTVQLNAGAEIHVDYGPARRRVQLLQGEAFFIVAKDPARPFVVTAGAVAVQAIGTQFAVRRADESIDVLVTEGRVELRREASPAPAESTASAPAPVDRAPAPTAIRVDAGGFFRAPRDPAAPLPSPAHVSTEEARRVLAWRERRVEFTGTPLRQAVALFNRANRLQLSFADDALGDVRISGIFWIDNPASFARLLELSVNVTAGSPVDDRIVLRPAAGPSASRD